MHYSIMTTAMTLRRLGCALCMPFISPFRSPFRPYDRAYAYRGLTTFAPLSMAVSGCIHEFNALVDSLEHLINMTIQNRLDLWVVYYQVKKVPDYL
ncbi:MAG: hypothetical protein KZQ60_15080 [Candidatus Thiodiazotropha sp. (ex Lucinoma aequizonata)]|nr:hypothetical protein [Candidatus Thiodiazotropha sp. (ex Lucinoma aequizonata)]